MTRTRRTFTPEFKLQMVRLFENGKPKSEIVREYDLTPSSLDKWVKNHQATGSFSHLDNLTDEGREMRQLRKETNNLRWKMTF
ncbi:transposase [Salinicoccus roseus]|uniref:transposase n=1 Tax=Salinicoccus roseus TaxID=45670 RepID=UPI003DA02FC3